MEETLIKRSDISIADFYKMNRDIIGEEVVILDSPLKNSLSKKSYIFFDFRRRIIVKNKEIIDNGINIGKNDPFLYFEKEFEIQQMLLNQSREASAAFEELQYLNKRIVFYNYVEADIVKKHGDVVESISNYDPEFNLKNHIKRLKDLNTIL